MNYPGNSLLLQQKERDKKKQLKTKQTKSRTKCIPLLESECIRQATCNFTLLREKLSLLMKECLP